MSTDRKLTYSRKAKELELLPTKEVRLSDETTGPEHNEVPFVEINGYEKNEGVFSYDIVYVISGGERKEWLFLLELITQKHIHSLRVVFESKANQGLQPYQMQELWKRIEVSREICVDGENYQLDAVDRVFLLSDVDEFYEQLIQIEGKNEPEHQWIISNPCFEMWLYYCFRDSPQGDLAIIEPLPVSQRSQEMKKWCNKLIDGGMRPEKAFDNMETGIKNSERYYEEDSNGIPVLYATQMHKMAQHLLKRMNRNDMEYATFLENKKSWAQKMRKCK